LKLDFNRKYTTIAIYSFFVLAAGILFYNLINHFNTVMKFFADTIHLLMPFIYGFCIAYLLNPLLKLCEKWLKKIDKKNPVSKIRRGLSVLLTYIIAFAFLTFFIWIVITPIKESIYNLSQKVQIWIPRAEIWIQDIMDSYSVSDDFNSQIISFLETMGQRLLRYTTETLPSIWTGAKNITLGLANFILGLIISIYMLIDKENFCNKIKKVLAVFLKGKYFNKVLNIFSDANKIFSRFIIGQTIDSLIVGTLCFIGMKILNLPFAPLVSFLVGGLNIIPYFGAMIGAVLGALIILVVSPILSLWFFIFVIILQQFDGNIMSPKIVGSSIGMPAFWVIFAILIGGGLFGVMGLILGVPLFALIYALFRSFINHRAEDRNIT